MPLPPDLHAPTAIPLSGGTGGRHAPRRVQGSALAAGGTPSFLARLTLLAKQTLTALGRRCAACGGVMPATDVDGLVCPDCARALAPRLGGYCPRCGELCADPLAPPVVCPACRRQEKPFAGCVFHGRYDGLLRDLVLDFKFRGRLGQGRLLGGLLVTACRLRAEAGGEGEPFPAPDMLVPVPLHPRRLAWRGFNQSLQLARVAGRTLGCPVRAEAMRRIRHTTPQSQLPGHKRRENIQGAFWADPAVVDGAAVVLVDDVMTTGATVETAALALRRAGASRVDVLVAAR